MTRSFTYWFAGLLVASVLSVITTLLFNLGAFLAFVVGCIFGFVFPLGFMIYATKD